MNSVITFFQFIFVATFATAHLYSPLGFFSENDVTSVTWAHAVNSQSFLDTVLQDSSIRMIEADVSRGRLVYPNGTEALIDIPVMAHPPTVTSDLSFSSFINQVIQFNKNKPLDERKGVKLDFKDYFSAAIAISQLGVRNSSTNGTELQFPVWVNADVLRGPVDSTGIPKTSPSNLFSLHQRYLPGAVLSLGWTTRFGPQSDGTDISEGKYTKEIVEEMIAAVQAYPEDRLDPNFHKNLPITYAVRAGIAANSIGELQYLINSTSPRATLTLWTGGDDPQLKPSAVQDIIKIVGRHKSFVDLPYSFQESAAVTLSFNNLCFVLASCSLRYIFAHL